MSSTHDPTSCPRADQSCTANIARVKLEVMAISGWPAIIGSDEREARSALRIERPYGSFSRTFQLPHPVDESRVSARLHLGILEIVLPKSSGARSRSIKVKVQE